MPTLHNPAENSLFCQRLGRVLNIDERVEITDEEAADLADSPIFVVEDFEADDDEAADAEDDDEDGKSPAPAKRTTAKRGSKRAEVSKAPETEKRG